VRERRHLGEEGRLDVLARDQQLDGLDAFCEQVLTLDREQPELVAPAPVTELADKLQAFVVAGGNQVLPSAALACSAIAPNAAGSLTARSASTLRSSSIPAFEQPCTNWL
jgi:hypothetical protein